MDGGERKDWTNSRFLHVDLSQIWNGRWKKYLCHTQPPLVVLKSRLLQMLLCERIHGECTSEVRGGFLWMAVSEMGSRNSAGVFEELLGGVCWGWCGQQDCCNWPISVRSWGVTNLQEFVSATSSCVWGRTMRCSRVGDAGGRARGRTN